MMQQECDLSLFRSHAILKIEVRFWNLSSTLLLVTKNASDQFDLDQIGLVLTDSTRESLDRKSSDLRESVLIVSPPLTNIT